MKVKTEPYKTLFDDGGFQDSLVWLLWRNQGALKECVPLLADKDFEPRRGHRFGRARWIVAGRALEYYKKFNSPIAGLLRSDTLHYAQKELGFSERQIGELEEYIEHLKKLKPVVPEAIVPKILRFKAEQARATLIDTLVEAAAIGKLDDAQWETIMQKGLRAGRSEPEEVVPTSTWPAPLGQAAMLGIAGDFVNLIMPHTEADPAAVLIQFLIGFGNVIGRRPFYRVEADNHHLNLYAAIVGATSKGRKGTSWGHAKNALFEADKDWAANRILSGLSSGEGLIWKVRDATYKRKASKEKDGPGYDAVEVDAGEEDKRLLIVEPEFARVLQVAERDGNNISAILRLAFDTGDLDTLTKNQALKARGAHISVLAHITSDELQRRFSDTAKVNGFANRFLWVCAQRSKLLPEGGSVDANRMAKLQKHIDSAVTFGCEVGQMVRSAKATKLWKDQYPTLSGERPGMLGAVAGRAEALVTRLSCLYALLDKKEEVLVQHLKAALEIWRYCEESARYLFGDSLGNPVADEILRKLRQTPKGLTRNDIYELFHRNKSAAVIEQALNELAKYKLVTAAKEKGSEGQKRPTERWVSNALNAYPRCH